MGGEIILAAAGIIAEAQLRQIQEHYSNVRVDRFVVMPNHIHAIIVIEGRRSKSFGERPGGAENKSPAGSLGDVVGAYKAGVTRACRLAELRDFAWQPRFYDRILHSNASVNAVRDYMDRNPRNWREDPDRVTVQTEKRAGHPEQG
jgi:REP element-mobilizing transposase RayT